MHNNKPFTAQQFEGKVFEFKKPDIRMYQAAPVRNFLVQNINGRWLYWGLVHILEVKHDYITKTTSGTFKIIYLYPPLHMPLAFDLIDRRDEFNFFKT